MNLDQLQQYADALYTINVISPVVFLLGGAAFFITIMFYASYKENTKAAWISSSLIAVGMGVFLLTVHIPSTQTETQFKADLKTAISERYGIEVTDQNVKDLIGKTEKFYSNIKNGGNAQLGFTNMINDDYTVQGIEMWKTKNDRFTLVTSGANKKELPVKN